MTKNITKAQIPQKDSKVISYPNLVDSESLKENSGVIRNPGTDFRLDKISNIAINKSAVERPCTIISAAPFNGASINCYI